eukprot:gene7920-10750_t
MSSQPANNANNPPSGPAGYHDHHFKSNYIESHYKLAKNQAIAFLFTIGAKAIVLVEQNSNSNRVSRTNSPPKQHSTKAFDIKLDPSNENSSKHVEIHTKSVKTCKIFENKNSEESNTSRTVSGLNEEAQLKKDMIYEEHIKLLRRKIYDKPGVLVLKNSKSGNFRLMHLRVKSYWHGIFFKWLTANNQQRKFKLNDSSLAVVPIVSKSVFDIIQSLSPNKDEITFSTFITYLKSLRIPSNKVEDNSLPIIRFKNGSKSFDVKFRTITEFEACLQIIINFHPSLEFLV